MPRNLYEEEGIVYSKPRNLYDEESIPYKKDGEESLQSTTSNILDAIKGAGIGAIQGGVDIGANVAQFPGDIYHYFTGKPGYEAPRPDFREYIPKSKFGQTASSLTELLSPLLLPVATPEILATRLLPRLGVGALTGAAESENRPLGAVLGAAGSALVPVAKYPKSITSKGIAEKIASDKAAQKELYSKQYTNLFKSAEDAGIKEIEKPEINIKTIEGAGMPKYYHQLKEFMKEPTLENAHFAQSELGQLQRKLEKIGDTTGLTPTQYKAYNEINNLRNEIKSNMFSKHQLGSQPELSDLYQKISEGYAKDVVPYNMAKGLEAYKRGELKASDLTNMLRRNKQFMAQLGDQYPLKTNAAIRSPLLKKTIGSALGIEGLLKAHEYFS